MTRSIAAGNWKMNKTVKEGESFLNSFLQKSIDAKVKVIIGVPALMVHKLSELSANSKQVAIAAQNCHHMKSGAYTGEISASMIKATGAEYVILGHSERRQYFLENDDLIKEKMDLALAEDLKVIYCCGEPLEVRKSNSHVAHVIGQMERSVLKLTKEQITNVVIAYEPIWAIGTGETASADQANEMHQNIRMKLAATFGDDIADSTAILYGGSVKPANAKELFAKEHVDGGLVGGASLDPDSFYEIANSF